MTRAAHPLSRFTLRALLFVALAMFGVATPGWSQSNPRPRGVTDTVDMTGPRFGITMLNQESVDTLLEKKNISVHPMISQFGWQFEHRLYTNGDGVTMLTEWIPLLSGLDQGVALPSLNWLTGLRTAGGTEFGIGPNITPLGVGLIRRRRRDNEDRSAPRALQHRRGDLEVRGPRELHDRVQCEAELTPSRLAGSGVACCSRRSCEARAFAGPAAP